ncbi:MAG: VanZ family protein [Mycetocola sp.]
MPDTDPQLSATTHPRALGRSTTMSIGSVAAVALVIGAICLWPTHVDASIAPTLTRDLDGLHQAGLPRWVTYAFIESTANVVMYIPLGALGFALARKTIGSRPLSGLAVIAAAATLSGTCELVQHTLLPGRTGDLRDIVANICGAAIGALIVLAIPRLRR